MHFRKMHGLGNDFVILDFREKSETLTIERIQQICDRNFGVGCDLLTVLEPSENADLFARFYNADGSESAACGNATRCVADIVMRGQSSEACNIETGRGILECTRAENDMVTVNMGAPLEIKDIPSPGHMLPSAISVNVGNPHCVFFVDELDGKKIRVLGPMVENMTEVFPEKTNVEFVQVINEGKIRQRTWERGVGVTLACGSGACAVAAAGVHTARTSRKVEIILDGGSLFIEQRDDEALMMTGPVAYVFDGELK